MVTIAEALQQTETAEASAMKRERQLQEAETKAGRIRVGGTIAEQFKFGAKLPEARRQARRQRGEVLAQIGIAREELGIFRGKIGAQRETIGQFQTSIGEQEKLLADIRLGKRIAFGEAITFGASQRARKFAKLTTQQRQSFFKRTKQLKALKEQQLTPLFDAGGTLAGFESEVALQSFELAELPAIQPGAVAPLEKAGLITVEKIPEAPVAAFTAMPEAPTFFERVEKEARRPSFLNIGLPGSSEVLGTLSVVGQEVQKGLRDPGFARATTGPTTLFDITPFGKRQREAKEIALGFGGRVVAPLVPPTKEAVAAVLVAPVIIGGLPAVIGRTGLGALGGFELGTAFKPGLTIEERTTAGLGAGLAFTGAVALPGRFSVGTRQLRTETLALGQRGILSPKGEKATLGIIKELKFFRGQPDVPPVKTVADILPPGLTQLEREAFIRPLEAERTILFGGKAEEIRGIRVSKDIDVFAKDNRRILNELSSQLREVSTAPVIRKGEAVGLGAEKAFDIKPTGRLAEFPLAQRPVGDGKLVRLSEQLSRSLAGTLQLRKGGKDIGSVILDTRAFLSQASTRLGETTFPFLKPIRQRAIARVEKRLEAFEQFALPDIRKQVAIRG